MKRKLVLTMEVEIEDMSGEERKECASQADLRPSDLPRLRDYLDDPMEVASLFGSFVLDSEEVFAGSMIYLKANEAEVVAAEWQ